MLPISVFRSVFLMMTEIFLMDQMKRLLIKNSLVYTSSFLVLISCNFWASNDENSITADSKIIPFWIMIYFFCLSKILVSIMHNFLLILILQKLQKFKNLIDAMKCNNVYFEHQKHYYKNYFYLKRKILKNLYVKININEKVFLRQIAITHQKYF